MDEVGGMGDDALADRVRSGDTAAFAELRERHSRAGLAAARQFGSIADPDDIVSEAYPPHPPRPAEGRGSAGGVPALFVPDDPEHRTGLAPGQTTPTSELTEDLEDPALDPETKVIENTVTVRAFRTLPERWQTVLWYTEVEGMDPAEAAPYLGLTANSAAALAYRAREGLKKAWLQAHVSDLRVPPECRWTTERMGDYARGAPTIRARDRFQQHLATCARCSILLEEIDGLSGRLAAVLLPADTRGNRSAPHCWLSS